MLDLWKRLNWTQVAAIGVILAGAGLVAHSVPPELWAKIDWKWAIGAFLSAAGVTASAALGRLFHPTDANARVEAVKTLSKPPEAP